MQIERYPKEAILLDLEKKWFFGRTTSGGAKTTLAKAIAEEFSASVYLNYDSLQDRKIIGVKFKDSDLLGIPYKVIFGRAFREEGKIELETRAGEKQILSKEEFLAFTKQIPAAGQKSDSI